MKSSGQRVVNISEARMDRRLKGYRDRLTRVMTANKKAVGRLYVTQLLFTKEGARAGRDLLLAHQHLLRVLTLLDRLANQGDIPAPRRTSEVEAIFAELDVLLERTGELTERTTEMLAGLKKD